MSRADIDFGIPYRFDAIAVDYVGTIGDDLMYYIRGGHAIGDPYKIYTYSVK